MNAPWPDCPVCGEPATSAHAQTITHQPRGMEPSHERNGVVTYECARHVPEVWMTADGVQVGGPPPNIVVKDGLL